MTTDQHIRAYVANDNVPPTDFPRGDAVGFNAILRERQSLRQNLEQFSESNTSGGRLGLWISMAIWLAFCGVLVWSFYTSQSVGIRIFAAIGLIWSSLWTRFCALDHIMPRLAEICLLTAFISFIGLLVTASIQLGFPLTLPAGLLVAATAALLISFLNNSKIALMCAIGCGLVWAGLQIDGYISSGPSALAIPALWAAIVWQSIRLKSGAASFFSLLIGYICLAGNSFQSYNNGQISLLYMSAGAAIIGMLHYRASKAAEDENMHGTSFHIVLGFIVANIGLLLLGNYAFDPAASNWRGGQDITPIARLVWLGVAMAGIIISFCAGMVRRKHKRVSLAGVLMNTLFLAAIPVAIWFEPKINSLAQAHMNASLYPAFGLFIFGIVTANIMFFIANAFRRSSYIQVVVGLVITPLLLTLSKEVDLIYQENWVAWMLGCFAALVAILLAVEPQLSYADDPDLRKSVSSS